MSKLRKFVFMWGGLIFISILLNVAGSACVNYLGLPFYFNQSGTFLATIIGGYFPGILVAYVSSVISAIFGIDTLYYACVGTFLAIVLAYLVRRGFLKRWNLIFWSIPILGIAGGCLGTFVSWLIYGFEIGSDHSALYVQWIVTQTEFHPNVVQLVMNVVLESFDKAMMLGLALFCIQMLPVSYRSYFEWCRNYVMGENFPKLYEKKPHVKFPLRVKVVFIVCVSLLLIGTVAIEVSYMLYRKMSYQNYVTDARALANMASTYVDGNRVNTYLSTGFKDSSYETTLTNFENLRYYFPFIKFIYVYQPKTDGNHVVFDLPTHGFKTDSLQDVLPYDNLFKPIRNEIYLGLQVEPVLSQGEFGTILTALTPILDSTQRCVAYVGVDLEMKEILASWNLFIGKKVTLFLGLLFLIGATVIKFVDELIVRPLNLLSEKVRDFVHAGKDPRMRSQEMLESLKIYTGDEIECLFHSILQTTTGITRAEHEKRVILDNVQHPLALFDSSFEFVTGNPAFMELYNATPQNSIAPDPTLILRLNQLLRKTMATHETQSLVAVFNQRNYYIEAYLVKELHHLEEGIVVAFIDLTERISSQNKMEEALRLERETTQNKNMFLSNIGHEIKTPLNAIVGYSDILSADKDFPQKYREDINIIRSSAKHLHSLFEAISEFMLFDPNEEKINFVTCDLRKKFADFNISFRDMLSEKNNVLDLNIDPKVPPSIRFDVPRLTQILSNLVHNAAKYTQNGRISLSATWLPPNDLRIECKDSGTGIPKEQLPKIFDLFYQVDATRDMHQFHGRGFGLAIVKKHVLAMGGEITVESELQKGASFIMTFHKVETDMSQGLADYRLKYQSNLTSEIPLNILILDDISLNVTVLTKLCEKFNVKTFPTTDVDDAFDLISKNKMDLILTDIWMPDMNGAAFARKVHQMEAYHYIPIYAVTADNSVQRNFDLSEFRGVIQKPVTIQLIQSIIVETQSLL